MPQALPFAAWLRALRRIVDMASRELVVA